MEYERDHQYGETNMTYKYKKVEAVSITLHGHWYFIIYICVYKGQRWNVFELKYKLNIHL